MTRRRCPWTASAQAMHSRSLGLRLIIIERSQITTAAAATVPVAGILSHHPAPTLTAPLMDIQCRFVYQSPLTEPGPGTRTGHSVPLDCGELTINCPRLIDIENFGGSWARP